MRRWTRLPDRKRLYRASPGIPFLVRVFQSRSGVSIAIGLDDQAKAAFDVDASPSSAQVRLRVVATLVGPCRFRHAHGGRRYTSIPPAFGLMTESACGPSTRPAPARCSLASILATMRHREPSRLDVNHPSIRRERTLNSAEGRYPAMVRQPAGVVYMLGKQSTSVSDAIQDSGRVGDPRGLRRGRATRPQ